MECIFTNDNNVKISLPHHSFSQKIAPRDNHEVMFRRINTYLILHDIIEKDKNIIDMGAWVGDNSIPWSKNINGTVYAIDPSQGNCDFIKIVAELNNINNIKIIQKAISDKKETLMTNDNIDHCSFVYNNLNGKTKVESCSLDDLYSEQIISNIGYIHLDVEGMEFRVILGAHEIIKDFRPIITFEQHLELDDYIGLSEHFKNKDYDVYIVNEILYNCRPDCRNFIAFPKEKITYDLINNIQVHMNTENIFIKI